MTRSELYHLVWKEPMIHVAKRFGISDVALRKTCVRHNIPTPPLGYWAKLAHGKKVIQPTLPPPATNARDHIDITARPQVDLPESVAAALSAAEKQKADPAHRITVAKQRSGRLHPIVAATEKALRKEKEDHEGFLHCGGAECFKVEIGRGSVERVILTLDTLIKALIERNCTTTSDKDQLKIIADGEPFAFRIYETKDKKAYEPTSEDLRRQAKYDDDSRRWQTLYTPGRKVWQTWSHSPSGRLCIEVTDPTRYRWNSENVVGRWYDRKTTAIEDQLGAIVVELAPAAALIKHRRAAAKEQERLRAEAAERRQREQERRERAKKRHDFLLQKADAHINYQKLVTLAEYLAPQAIRNGTDAFDRLFRILTSKIELDAGQLERGEINAEAERLELFGIDDVA